MEALEGIRVIDLSSGVAGPHCTKLLADFGADVIKIEPPGGDPTRAVPPFAGDIPDPERSLLFLHLNTNKRSLVADTATADGARLVRRLIEGAQVVVEDLDPGASARLGLGYEQLAAEQPELVYASITPWGQDGPYVEQGLRASDLVLQGMGGPVVQTGARHREPLKLGGSLALMQAGLVAAYGIMLARLRVEAGGPGDHVDVSVYETQMGSRDRRSTSLTAYAYQGTLSGRRGLGIALASGPQPCLDGYVNITAIGPKTDQFVAMIGRADLVGDPRLRQPPLSLDPAFVEEIQTAYLGWSMARTKLQALQEAQRHGLLSGVINTPADVLADAHFRDRGVWEEIDHPVAGSFEYPGRPLLMSETPRKHACRAPLLGEHSSEVLAELEAELLAELERPAAGQPPPERADGASSRVGVGTEAAAGTPRTPRTPRTAGRLPLEGVRVADITVVWAGPHVTQLLAEWGAEVIRVEPRTRIQPSTRGAERVTPSAQQLKDLAAQGQTLGAFPDFEGGADPWNRGASFNSHARNKLSMTADIMTAEGREAMLRLVEVSDVVVENNVPETIDKAGIGWDELHARNPALVMLRMPGFGLSGPYQNYRGYGLHMEAMIGHTHIRSYPDEPIEAAGDVVTSDAIAGIQGAFAVCMALRHVRRTGHGQLLEQPLAEAFLPIIGDYLLDYTANGRDTEPQGNRHRSHAPHNYYPCREEGAYLAIDCDSDEAWRALCGELGAAELLASERWQTAAGRHGDQRDLDRALAEQTRQHDQHALFLGLQAVGVICGPVQDEAQAYACPQLAARGFFEEATSASAGTHAYPGLNVRLAHTPNALRSGPPLLGEHNAYVYRELLGYSAAEYHALEASQHVGRDYAPGVVRFPGDA